MSGKPQILIVDDDPQICSYLERLLSRTGYETKTARSGHEAAEFLAKTAFNLVILDVGLPDLDGYEIFDEIGRKSPDTMIIFITGNASVELAVEMLKRGAHDYLRKPFEPEELLKAVGNALDYKRMESERDHALETLQKAHDELEHVVENRTSELARANEQLMTELEELRQRIAELGAAEIEHKQAEEELRKSEERFSKAFNLNPSPMSITKVEDGRFLAVNESFLRVLGFKREQVIGLTPLELNLYVDHNERAKVLDTLDKEKKASQPEIEIRSKSGEVLIMRFAVKQLEHDDEECIIATAVDMTEGRLAEEALRESEERYRSLFQINQSVMLLIDPESAEIVDANPAACSFYGWSHEELTSMKITDINMLTREQVFQEMERAKSEERNHFFFRHRLMSEEILDVEVYSGPIRLHGKEFLYSIIHDISERKRAEEGLRKAHDQLEELVELRTAELIESNKELTREMLDRQEAEKAQRESEHRFRELVESSLVGICIIQQNQVIYQNPSMKRLLGPLPDGFENHVLDYIYPEDVEKCKAVYRQIASGKNQVVQVDFRFLPPGKKGTGIGLHWVQCRTSSVTLGGEESILLNIVDITKLKELERHVTIKSKMLSLGRVAAGIAHEIRNPLTGINSYLYTLDDICACEALDSDNMSMIKEIVGKIQVASNKIESVIKRVIDFSKPGVPQMTLADINTSLEDAISLSEVTVRRNGINLKKSLAQDLPRCYADTHMIEQVILNLIDNAAKALKKVEKLKIIQISSSSKNNSIVIGVSDSGPGVPATLKDRVFDPFVTTETDGSGIGLSIAQRLIADHGGTIDIGTSKWGGAEFTIELPIEKRLNPR